MFVIAPWNPETARRNVELHVMQLVCEQCLVAWKEKTERKKAKHKNQASSTRVLFLKVVFFIPQLKSLLWQIARFTDESERHIQT